jgi:hypothetical protein
MIIFETQISRMNGGSKGPGRLRQECELWRLQSTGSGWSMYLILDGPRKDLIGTLYLTYGGCKDGCLFSQTWVEWLRWQMGRISGEYDKGIERRHIAKVLAERRRRDAFRIILQNSIRGFHT